MLREKAYILGRVNVLIDLALCVAGFFLAFWLRTRILAPYCFPNLFKPTVLSDQLWVLALMPLFTVLALSVNQYYSSQRIQSGLQTLRVITLSVVEAAFVSLVVLYLLKKGHISRGQLLVYAAVVICLIAVKSWFVRRTLRRLRRKGRNFRRILLVGSGEALRRFGHMLENHPFWGFSIEGVISDDPAEVEGDGDYGHPVVGGLDKTLDYLWDHQIDEVVFLPSKARHDEIVPLLEGCEEMGVRTHLALNSFWHTIAQPTIGAFEDVPVVTYSPVQLVNTPRIIKYSLDRLGAACLLLALSPVFLAVMAAIRLTSKRGDPIFYGQTRCGLNGKEFTCWKFRSMRVDADKERERLEALNEMSGPVFKIKDDPRITKVGRFLRKTSLDELPQIYNVLRGEMSLVGPRPPIPDEVLQYDRWQRRRLSMKPGITCLWQVSGRNQLPFETWMKLDLEYIDNWSLLLDLKILLKTVYVVLVGHGAM